MNADLIKEEIEKERMKEKMDWKCSYTSLPKNSQKTE